MFIHIPVSLCDHFINGIIWIAAVPDRNTQTVIEIAMPFFLSLIQIS